MYLFLAGLGLLVVVGLHQLLESRKVSSWLCVFLFLIIECSQCYMQFEPEFGVKAPALSPKPMVFRHPPWVADEI